ncbi:heme o synthase [Bacillus fonticola]|uniref:heme o synthase n=1 Tax=Bacillus fonticola TaxID=2728853 RepID=UPI001473FC19
MATTKLVNETTMDDDKHSLNAATTTSAWQDFLALIKIGIVNSNAMTTFTGVWLALYFTERSFFANFDIVLYAMIGSSLVIAGSCSYNNYFDRDIDPKMERTKNRPTVSGRFQPATALTLGLFFIAIGSVLLFLTTPMAGVIGLIGAFTYCVLYTMWSKRKTTFNTVVGSISGAVPPLIGWTAVEPQLTSVPIALFLIMFIWQPPHFLALAMRRKDEYARAGIPMLPVVHGFAVTKRQMIAWVACLLPLPFYLYPLGTVFLIIATALNIGWLVLALKGLRAKDDIKWATGMFVYSLNYLTILFVSMVIVTFIPF